LSEKPKKHVVLCVPTLTRPFQQTLDAIRASVPALEAAGWQHSMVNEIGCPYISAARATMLRKALDAKATVVVFLDHDMSWPPEDLVRLIETDGDVVCGTYRFKKDEEEYMGALVDTDYPVVRPDGCMKMAWGPAGFLKVTRNAVNRIMDAYPELCYGEKCAPAVDLFQHGAHKGTWWGEDAAFGRRWNDCGGELWCIPDLLLTHHSADKAFPGNFHIFMRKQPGGDLSDNPIQPIDRLKAVVSKLKAVNG